MNLNRPDMTEDVKYKDYTNKSLQMDSNPVTMPLFTADGRGTISVSKTMQRANKGRSGKT